MSSLVLHGPTERSALPRWGVAAIIVALLHAALIAVGVFWYVQNQTAGMQIPPILVDLVPISASPETQPLDLAVGPTMQEAPEPQVQPEPQPEFKEELIPPTPLQEKPVVAAPPEPKQEQKVTPKQVPKPEKPKPVKQVQKQSTAPPAPKTTAAPQAERRAPATASAVGSVSSAAAAASYNQRLVAHIQRFKQFPAAAKAAGESGVATVRFTVDRSGNLLSLQLTGRTGRPNIDADAPAWIRRAQPFPAFPPELALARQTFNVPLNYILPR